MNDKAKNIPASMHAKLLNISRKRRADFNQLLVQYAIERLLFRLSRSKHRERFILKGAMLYPTWNATPFRSTRDLDLLGFGDASLDALVTVFQEICSQEYPEDGIEFISSSIKAEEIRALEEYAGVRVLIDSRLGSARLKVQVDIGVGDAVIPPPAEIEYPTLLDHPKPQLRAYRPETVIAEKLHALTQHGMMNTRMKDYFDLLFLSRTFAFDAPLLAKAVQATFERRGSGVPTETPIGLSSEFGDSQLKQTQWKAFYQKVVAEDSVPSLPEVVSEIAAFLLPLLNFCSKPDTILGNWPPRGPWSNSNA